MLKSPAQYKLLKKLKDDYESEDKIDNFDKEELRIQLKGHGRRGSVNAEELSVSLYSGDAELERAERKMLVDRMREDILDVFATGPKASIAEQKKANNKALGQWGLNRIGYIVGPGPNQL